jgi:RNA polymerase sigma-70 factor (ECF subfamily)
MPESLESAGSSDAAAIERTLAGDRDAFRLLVERHSTSLFRLAYRMTNNQQDAEEIVQEAFLRAYQKLGKFEARANFGTWIYRIVANCALDRLRKRRSEEIRREHPLPSPDADDREQEIMTQYPDSRPLPDRIAAGAELREKVEQALGDLSPAERAAFVMRHWEGRGIEEIAKALGLRSNATKNTVFRAVQKLRRALEPFVAPLGADRPKSIQAAFGAAPGTEQ